MKWWSYLFGERTEQGQQANLGEEFSSYLAQQIGGTYLGTSSAAPVQQVAALVGRCFATATVLNGRPSVATALSPRLLFLLARDLVLAGESVWYLKTTSAQGLSLYRVQDYVVQGGYDERSRTYRVTLAGPTTTTEISTTRDRIVHVEYVKMTGEASTFSQLVGRVEEHLRDESRAPRGTLIPTPDVGQNNDDLKAEIGKMRGHATLVRSMVGRWQGGGATGGGAASDWRTQRIGMDPPESLVELQEQNHRHAISLHGVGSGLFGESSGAARESYRLLLQSLVHPLAALVLEELRERLDSPNLRFDFSSLRAADISSRTRALKNLVESGVNRDRAMILSGLSEG